MTWTIHPHQPSPRPSTPPFACTCVVRYHFGAESNEKEGHRIPSGGRAVKDELTRFFGFCDFFSLHVKACRDACAKESEGRIGQHGPPEWQWVGEGLDVKIWGKNLDPEPALAWWPTDQMSLWFPERIHGICISEKLYLTLAGHKLYVDHEFLEFCVLSLKFSMCPGYPPLSPIHSSEEMLLAKVKKH